MGREQALVPLPPCLSRGVKSTNSRGVKSHLFFDLPLTVTEVIAGKYHESSVKNHTGI